MTWSRRSASLAVAALVGLGGALVPAAGAASASVPAATAADTVASEFASGCGYNSYDGPGSIFTSWKGDWTKISEGKALLLQTAKDGWWVGGDRSSGYLSNAGKGDKAWVEITHSGDKPGSSYDGTVCGTTSDRKRDEYFPSPGDDPRYALETRWYYHSTDNITDRWMRACADVGNGKECTPWYSDS